MTSIDVEASSSHGALDPKLKVVSTPLGNNKTPESFSQDNQSSPDQPNTVFQVALRNVHLTELQFQTRPSVCEDRCPAASNALRNFSNSLICSCLSGSKGKLSFFSLIFFLLRLIPRSKKMACRKLFVTVPGVAG
jgi:hypothetical protein